MQPRFTTTSLSSPHFCAPNELQVQFISLVLQPRLSDHPVIMTTFLRPESGRVKWAPLYNKRVSLAVPEVAHILTPSKGHNKLAPILKRRISILA